jgi:uncharacterized protein YraI
MSKLQILAVATLFFGLFALPAAALAAPGYTTARVHMRSGPGVGYPAVATIPARGHVDIHGCLEDRDWCDVTWRGYRGWVSARYLNYFYRGHYVYLPEYWDTIDVPIVGFVLGTYWHEHYRGRSWYRRRTHWDNYWRRHGRRGYHPGTGPHRPRPPHAAPAAPTRSHVRPPRYTAPSTVHTAPRIQGGHIHRAPPPHASRIHRSAPPTMTLPRGSRMGGRHIQHALPSDHGGMSRHRAPTFHAIAPRTGTTGQVQRGPTFHAPAAHIQSHHASQPHVGSGGHGGPPAHTSHGGNGDRDHHR